MNGLVSKAKKHDKVAFTELIRQCESSMYKVAISILANAEDVADAMQETILICWEKIETLKKNEYFKTWMTRILINECYAILRKKKNFCSEEEIQDSGVMESAYEKIEWLELLQGMEEKYRTVLVLYYAEGFKVREIADIMNLNVSSVKDRLVKARDIYKKLYQK
ncbi:MAG: sigma-70 family RNA polymerase sigma factor [Lachnospiraceae bacterium]|nr:sigma-70 family RNA polymerase sigma factor [Lachnospiraceae bacterium]